MARVITFSTTFPEYHPKFGQETEFIFKLWNSFKGLGYEISPVQWAAVMTITPGALQMRESSYDYLLPKHHTFRLGNRWKVGDKFSPRVWSGKPYNSKQIVIGPDIEIKKVWDVELTPALWWDECKVTLNGKSIDNKEFLRMASNDGLTASDLLLWLAGPKMADSRRKPFNGQIICWNENVNY